MRNLTLFKAISGSTTGGSIAGGLLARSLNHEKKVAIGTYAMKLLLTLEHENRNK